MTDVRFLKDEEGNIYYPVAHRDYIEDLVIPDNLENLDEIENDVSKSKLDISNLQSTISDLVKDTGWVNINLKSPVIAYSSAESPQARMLTFNGVHILTIRGAVKGVTNRINTLCGTLNSDFSSKIAKPLPFVQNASVSGDEPNFTRMRIEMNGDIEIERITNAAPTESNWFPLDCTFIL